MFTKPKYGWTDLTLDQKNFFPASYLTDVPMIVWMDSFRRFRQDQQMLSLMPKDGSSS